MEQTILSFIKFGQEEHILDMFNNGNIYLNTIQSFKSFEDDSLRGDKYEGVSKITNYPKGNLEIKSLNYKGEYLSLQVRESFENVVGNIFSLYCISSFHIPDPLEFKIEKKISEFGTHCIVIKDNVEFLRRMEDCFKIRRLTLHHNFVSYYDASNFNGKLNVFQKPNEYSYQNEFRFYADSGLTEPLILTIGSLSEIAEIYESKDLIRTLQLKLPKIENHEWI